MNTPINQHYVPQFLLRNFQIIKKTGSESAIFIFDKKTIKDYQAVVKSTATGRYFYEVKEKGFTIEDKLADYEDLAGPIIRKILENKNIKSITRKEKTILTKFICLQILRVPAMRNSFSQLTEMFEQKFNFFENSGISKPNEEEDKITHCNFILDNVNTFFPFIYNKDWLLCESNSESYIIGDNPVVLNNTLNQERGSLGLTSSGVEIYMPLSPKYCLLLVCNSVRKTITKKLADIPADLRKQPFAENLNQFASNLKGNETVKSSHENVVHANSLQILFSERFLYSHKREFSLPSEMVAEYGGNNRIFKIY